MNRRQLLVKTVAVATVGVAGCVGGSASPRTAQVSESPRTATDTAYPTRNPAPSETVEPSNRLAGGDGGCAATSSTDGPQSPYDYLALHPVPSYVTEYADSVVLRFDELDAAAERAVLQALKTDGEYRECSLGRGETDVMALFSYVERRWEVAGKSFDHTYLRYEDDYYAINIVQEGDFIRVKSIPCTAEACPGTPTPPS